MINSPPIGVFIQENVNGHDVLKLESFEKQLYTL